ncbi:alternate-type signal peptide domain-containing protein [Cellulomonas sp. ICMP 17802]|uniref:alternate-type signal peptide domain-containing protein n=1 Tax=Cellulomonas sp. ICMP 17802 TaxID=3239199 RepID=UPI00351B3FB3
MRKTTKGAIAVGAGVALLLGGAGTMAYWNTSTTLGTNASITSGSLTATPTGAASWKWADATAFAPATDVIVPGDVVSVTRTFTVAAKGNHLKADVVLSGGALGTGSPLTVASTFTNTAPTAPATVVANGTNFTVSTGGSNASTTFTFTVTYTITFPSSTTGTTFQTGNVSLADATITVTQIP